MCIPIIHPYYSAHPIGLDLQNGGFKDVKSGLPECDSMANFRQVSVISNLDGHQTAETKLLQEGKQQQAGSAIVGWFFDVIANLFSTQNWSTSNHFQEMPPSVLLPRLLASFVPPNQKIRTHSGCSYSSKC